MKHGFVEINAEKARDIIKANHQKMSKLSQSLGYSQSWLQHALKNGSIHTEDIKALEELGCDLRPAQVVHPTVWLVKIDIGLIIETIIRADKDEAIYSIANDLGIDWKTVKRYIETWETNHFGIKPGQLLDLYDIIEKEKNNASWISSDNA